MIQFLKDFISNIKKRKKRKKEKWRELINS